LDNANSSSATVTMPSADVNLVANFTLIILSTDATLSDLKVSGNTITNFSPSELSYNVELESGTTIVPTIIATANDINANFLITDATALPGTTTVTVTAEDGITIQTYSVNFTIATSVNELSLNNNINIYPNPSNGIFNISIEINKISNGSIDIFNSIGSKVYMKDLQNNTDLMHTVDLSTMPKGMYFVKIIVNEKSFTKELIYELLIKKFPKFAVHLSEINSNPINYL